SGIDKQSHERRIFIMPRGDSTGPMGMGPMTGRQAGYCAGYNMPGFLNNACGRGMGMGFGRGANLGGRGGGFRRRNRFFATGVPGRTQFGSFAASFQQADPEMEKQALKSQAEYLQSEMDAIKKRLDELNAKAQAK
ncbi:MAG: DUF5320 domain-containing protein, partial [Smithella sp.]